MSNAKKATAPTSPNTLDKLTTLLEIAGIKKVYYVDDENNLTKIAFENVSAQITNIVEAGNFDNLRNIPFTYWDLDNAPPEDVADLLIGQWDDISGEEQVSFYEALLKISGNESSQLDFSRSAKILEQFPEGMLKICSPQEWDNEKITLSEMVNDGSKILILFDESLTHAGGKWAAAKGQDLIIEVKNMRLTGVICTLLTNLIVDVNGELQFRNQIIEKAGGTFEVNDFFPLAKIRLDIPDVFADGLRKVILNEHIEIIKQHTVEVIKTSYSKAAAAIASFDTYDFEDIILKTSLKEGVWEPNTLVRICDIKFENELKTQMVDTNYASLVNGAIASAQPFYNVTFPIPNGLQPYTNKYSLRHDEIYDKGDVINKLRKPLENGDIFEIGNDKYILVAQACDMMVRATGAKAGLRSAKVVHLFKIETQEYSIHKEKKEKKGVDHYLRDKHALPYFNDSTDNVGVVMFSDYIIVDVDLLDLCVFNDDGECSISLNTANDKRYYSLAWQKRYDYLHSKLTESQTKIQQAIAFVESDKSNFTLWKRRFFNLINLLPEPIMLKIQSIFKKKNTDIGQLSLLINAISPQIFLAHSPNIVLNETTAYTAPDIFKFPAKRVLKYKDAGATYLLERYTRHLSRIAEPHDFAK